MFERHAVRSGNCQTPLVHLRSGVRSNARSSHEGDRRCLQQPRRLRCPSRPSSRRSVDDPGAGARRTPTVAPGRPARRSGWPASPTLHRPPSRRRRAAAAADPPRRRAWWRRSLAAGRPRAGAARPRVRAGAPAAPARDRCPPRSPCAPGDTLWSIASRRRAAARPARRGRRPAAAQPPRAARRWCPARCCARTDAAASGARELRDTPVWRSCGTSCALYGSPLDVVVTPLWFVHRLGLAVHTASTVIHNRTPGSVHRFVPSSGGQPCRPPGVRRPSKERDPACGARTAGTPTPGSSTPASSRRGPGHPPAPVLPGVRPRFTTVEEATLAVIKRSGVTEPFSRQKVVSGVRRACQGRPSTRTRWPSWPRRVEEAVRATGVAEVPSDEVGLAILGPLRELDEVAYLRFASVYQAFSSIDDFEKAITDLRSDHRDPPPHPALSTTRTRSTCIRSTTQTGKDRPHDRGAQRRPHDRGRRHRRRHASRRHADAEPGLPAQRPARSSASTPTAGVHPYDEVTWERRDVVMTNWRDGSINFEQRGVEFPDFWSVNAANIVTTKYFRGAVGTEVREWSLRQLIDRVVHKYRAAGREHGYFRSADDAEIFEHELTWMLLHQVFSFNSPVWFNVGTTSPQQVSACFILAVDDTMDSILNWYREEGLIFKGGSGAGLNLSRIRSSKELLSSGGTASGPGQLHARRRRLGRHDQVRRRHPARGEDGRARHRPPRHRGVRRDQGARGGQDPRAARRRLRHGPRRRRHHLASSTRTPTTPSASPTSSCARSRRAREFGLRARSDARGHRDRRRQGRCSARSRRRRGSAPTRASSTTTRSTTGTPTPRPAGSPRPTRARST